MLLRQELSQRYFLRYVTRAAMASVIRLITAATFLAALSAVQAEAAPITFTFEGTATGFLANTFFDAAHFVITANADTANILTSTVDDGTRSKDFSLDTNSARIFISGLGTSVFDAGTRVFDSRDVTINSQGPIDILAFAHSGFNGSLAIALASPVFGLYDLSTSIGPLFFDNVTGLNGIGTTRGTVNFETVVDVTFTAVTHMPEPATLALLSIAFAGIGLARWHKLN